MFRFKDFKARVKQLKGEVYTLYWACHDPRVPWYAKVLIAAIVAYAASPIDLVPDFIPVLGYLDDLILIPLGIALALKIIPPEVLQACRQKANRVIVSQPQRWVVAFVIISIWVVAIYWLVKLASHIHT